MRSLAWMALTLGAAVVMAPGHTAPWASAARNQTPRAGAGSREHAVPFVPGETLVYDVTWSNFLTAGTATLTVRDKRASYGSTAYYVTAEGRPSSLIAALYPVYYKADTLLDTATLLPQRGSIYSDEKGRRSFRITQFDRAAKSVRYEVQTGEPARVTHQASQPAPPQAQDALSAIFFLRSMTLAAGATVSMPVVVNGHIYRVQAVVTGRETVSCGLGEVDAWRVTPTLLDESDRSDGRDMAIWISVDARRLPVKLQGQLPVGAFALTLTRSS